MMRRTAGGLILALAVLSAGAQEGEETKFLSLSGREYVFERIGSITTFLCSPADASEDCLLLKSLNLQPQVDWEKLVAKAVAEKPAKKGAKKKKKPAPLPEEMTVDQFGGSWTVSLLSRAGPETPDFLKPHGCKITPNFSGYKVTRIDGKFKTAEVLRTQEELEEARKEQGIDPATGKKKTRFGGLFE